MAINIRLVKEIDGCRHFQELERVIWASPDLETVPTHILITVLKNGGALLGAYADDGPPTTGGMVGAAFWWLGTGVDPVSGQERMKVCSHIVGVHPEWQGQRIGLRLKLAQRQTVLDQGLTDWITWTYDPLYRTNGVFNIHRLGATCCTYYRNVYGEMEDALNRGVPSDRCQVDWRLQSPHVLHDIDTRRRDSDWNFATVQVLPSRRLESGFLAPVEADPALDGGPLAVPIPEDIGAIRREDGGLSMAWRLYVRNTFEAAFDAGYTLVDCVVVPEHGWHYVLVREYA